MILLAAVGSGRASQANAPTALTGNLPWITILCKFADIPDEPKPLPFFQTQYQNSFPGLDHYWREASYNTINLAGSSAAGWFTLPQPRSYYVWDMWGNGHPTFDADRAHPDCLEAADPTVNFQPYYGIQLMFNGPLDGSSYGAAPITLTLDGVVSSWALTDLGSETWINLGGVAHEMGHGFGFLHSGNSKGQVYKDQWDLMGDTTTGCTRGGASHVDPTYGCLPQHIIAYDKDLDGWIDPVRIFTANPGHGATITLQQAAQPPAGNILIAVVPVAGSSTHFYTVEARRLAGYDGAQVIPGNAVIIHDVQTTRMNPAWLVDANPNDSAGGAGAMWTAGMTYTDAANGIKIVVKSDAGTGFVVGVYNQVSPIETLSLAGPTSGSLGTPYTFTATTGPTTATQPISYTWSATGLATIVHQNGFSDLATFTWSTGGVKTVTVTAQNPGDSLASSQNFIILVAPSSVTINGASLAATGQSVAFIANVNPISATPPITYTWSATSQANIVHVSSAISDTVNFTWTTAGTKTVSVSAANPGGVVSNTASITISTPPPGSVAPSSVKFDGPSSITVGQTATITATVSPADATVPITYTWSATGQANIVHVSSAISDVANFTWTTAGTKTVSVSAANPGGVVSNTASITINTPPPGRVAPSSVKFDGPSSVTVGQTATITATVSPADATVPITYTWQANVQPIGPATIIHVNGLTDMVSFTWSTPGTVILTLTVSNPGGSVQATYVIDVAAPPGGRKLYLPVVIL